MGLCIALQSESGDRSELITDEKNVLDGLIGYPDWKEFPMLASIDRYGNTIFNRMQIKPLLAEWETLLSKATTREQYLLAAVKSLGEKSQRDVHQYLVFIGD